MNKAIFLDRDGTINIDYGYVYKIDDFKFIDGVLEGLRILQDLGYKLIIITNQSGIGRGYYTVEDYEKLNNYMIEELHKNGIEITDIFYCPHVESDNCECRKPKTKLYYDAIEKYNIDLEKSYAIGDKERDLCICKNEKIKGILLANCGSDKFICQDNLLSAAKYIEREEIK